MSDGSKQTAQSVQEPKIAGMDLEDEFEVAAKTPTSQRAPSGGGGAAVPPPPTEVGVGRAMQAAMFRQAQADMLPTASTSLGCGLGGDRPHAWEGGEPRREGGAGRAGRTTGASDNRDRARGLKRRSIDATVNLGSPRLELAAAGIWRGGRETGQPTRAPLAWQSRSTHSM